MEPKKLKHIAEMMLEGVGDMEHEFRDCTRAAYHLRRRLTIAEQEITGPAIDLRGTPEALNRFETMKASMHQKVRLLALEELAQ